MVFDRHLESGHAIWKAHSNKMENAVKFFSQVYTAQIFQVNIEYYSLYTISKLFYHRFYKNNLLLPVALYRTTTDQNVNTAQRNPILCPPYILYWDSQCRWLCLVENLTKSGVPARKNGLKFICSILINSYRCYFYSLFAQNYIENIAIDCFLTCAFRLQTTCCNFGICMSEMVSQPDTTLICFHFSFRLG